MNQEHFKIKKNFLAVDADPARKSLLMKSHLIAILLIGFFVFSLCCLALWMSLGQALDERTRRAEVAARMLERGVSRTLESAESALVSVGEAVGTSTAPDPRAVRARIADHLRFAPHIRQIVLARGAEVVVDSSDRGLAWIDLDAIGLGHPGAGLSLGLRIGRPGVGRYLPARGAETEPSMHSVLAVGYDVPDTGLTVLAALNPAYFTSIFEDAGLGDNSRVGVRAIPTGDFLMGDRVDGPLPAELLGGREAVLVSEGLWPATATAYRLSTRYPVAVVVTVSHADTVREWLNANGGVLTLLGVVSAVVVAAATLLALDVAKRLRLQEQVRLLAHALEQSPAVVLVTDSRAAIRYTNPAFTATFDYPFAEVEGRNPRFLGGGATPDSTYRSLWESLERGEPWRGEFVNRARDGRPVIMSSSISAVRDPAGQVTHYVGIMQDVTELKRAEQQRERLIARLRQTNSDLERFAEVAAHHLQEPARRMATFVQRIMQSRWAAEAPEEIVTSLNFVRENSLQLGALIRDIQVYLAADQARGEVAQLDIGTVVTEILSRLDRQIREAQAEITLGDLPPFAIDRPRATDLFQCLIENALKYRRPGVPLEVSITGEVTAAGVRYRVADNGIGIPPVYRERAFGVFERLHASSAYTGTGVGLAVVRRIAESFGGRAWIEESPSGGVIACVELTRMEAG